MKLRILRKCIRLAPLLLVYACGAEKSDLKEAGEALVTVGDSTLMMQDVLSRIPSGLSPADSASMFRRIVDEWVRGLVLTDFAIKNVPDPERIERLANEYRNNLIVNAYMQSMTISSPSEVSEERIRQYYDANKDNMVLEEPLVKGALLKVSQNDASLDDLRRWMAEFSDKSIDHIEEAGLRHAHTYKYFKDQWQSWSEIAQQIPYRFFDADAFVTSTRNFETTDAGSTYLLHISDYVLAGSEMPYEYARYKIREILGTQDLAMRREKLVSEIYRRQIEQGVLKPEAYDPVAHQMIEKPGQ